MLNAQWEALKQKTENRRMVLEAAKEIHTFNRDANDTLQRIQVSKTSAWCRNYFIAYSFVINNCAMIIITTLGKRESFVR